MNDLFNSIDNSLNNSLSRSNIFRENVIKIQNLIDEIQDCLTKFEKKFQLSKVPKNTLFEINEIEKEYGKDDDNNRDLGGKPKKW